jgi:hypothetical protein
MCDAVNRLLNRLFRPTYEERLAEINAKRNELSVEVDEAIRANKAEIERLHEVNSQLSDISDLIWA